MADPDASDPAEEQAHAFAGSRLFESVFSRGMALVEETAGYLDGPGREESKALPRDAALTYSAWSMELTTRLMQAASWLVMQKAVRDGDMRREDAAARKYRIRRDDTPVWTDSGAARQLPARFVSLIHRAEALYDQVCWLDEALYQRRSAEAGANTVSEQIGRLQQAADTGVFDPLKAWRRAK
jgi:regulator of CtrA degradation